MVRTTKKINLFSTLLLCIALLCALSSTNLRSAIPRPRVVWGMTKPMIHHCYVHSRMCENTSSTYVVRTMPNHLADLPPLRTRYVDIFSISEYRQTNLHDNTGLLENPSPSWNQNCRGLPKTCIFLCAKLSVRITAFAKYHQICVNDNTRLTTIERV